jgi:peptidoglycan/LPS O-acetylase OafA/YrhL
MLKAADKLNHIDQLRGVAILLVMLVHVCQSQGTVSPLLYIASDFGKIGVQLFFFLSAYTLCLSFSKGRDHSLVDFYIRRYFRIAPLYYTGIIIYFLMAGLPQLNLHGALSHAESYTGRNVAANLFFVHGLVPAANNSIVPGGWSIGTEMLFYAMFPGMYYVYTRYNRVRSLILIPVIAFLVANAYAGVAYYLGAPVFSDLFYYYFILNQLPVFTIGVSYFFLEQAGYLHYSKKYCLILFALLFSLSFVLMYKLGRNISLPIFIAGLSFSFLFSLFKQGGFKFRLLARIGQLSFSIYIFHFLFAWPLSTALASWLHLYLHAYLVYAVCYAVVVLLSMMVATVSEYLIEKPGIKLGKQLIRKRQAGAVILPSK